jgi:DNA-binding CsgD family transcriptional regulator
MSYYIKGGRYKRKPLDERIIEALRLMSHGMKTPEIADLLGITPKKLNYDLLIAMRRLDCMTYYHLLATAIRDGIIE